MRIRCHETDEEKPVIDKKGIIKTKQTQITIAHSLNIHLKISLRGSIITLNEGITPINISGTIQTSLISH